MFLRCRSDTFALTLDSVLCDIQQLCIDFNNTCKLETIKESSEKTMNNNNGNIS